MLEPLPALPEVVATWLASLAQAGRADSTIARNLAAIAWHHRQAGHVAPQYRDARDVIADTLAGIRREQRARPTRKKSAILAADLARMIAAAEGSSARAIRDRAVMALGLAAALRRSELVALQLADIDQVREGLKLTIRHSKTDQEGEGQDYRGTFREGAQARSPPQRVAGREGRRGGAPILPNRCSGLDDERAYVRSFGVAADPALRGQGRARSCCSRCSLASVGVPDRSCKGRGLIAQNAGGLAAEEGRSVAGLRSRRRAI